MLAGIAGLYGSSPAVNLYGCIFKEILNVGKLVQLKFGHKKKVMHDKFSHFLVCTVFLTEAKGHSIREIIACPRLFD